MATRKRYSKEFQDDACRLARREGYTRQRAADELGIPAPTLTQWMRRRGMVDRPVDHEIPASDDPQVLKAQLRQLQQRVSRLEAEKEILKKATAFFAGQEQP